MPRNERVYYGGSFFSVYVTLIIILTFVVLHCRHKNSKHCLFSFAFCGKRGSVFGSGSQFHSAELGDRIRHMGTTDECGMYAVVNTSCLVCLLIG